MNEFVIENPAQADCLDIRFGGDYTELLLGGTPLALTWSVNDGSILDHLISFSHPDGAARWQQVREALSASADPEPAAVMAVVGGVLASGTYQTLLTDYYEAVVCLPECSSDMAHPEMFYGGCFTLVTTLPDTALSEERVSYYERLIRSGQRPLGVALCCIHPEFKSPTTAFLLDGHHKAEAYHRCRMGCQLLLIARRDPPSPVQEYPRAHVQDRLNG